MTARLERYRDMAPQHLRMARRMLDGWGEFDAESMPAELRRFAAGDGCDAVDLAGRLLAGALEYLRFALEMIEDEEGRMMSELAAEYQEQFEHLQAENDKLRELVRELWNCALQYHRFDVYRHEIGVDGCGIGCTANGEGCCACKLEQRMRKLGVEI